MESAELSLEDLGSESNRWFSEQEEARTWLRKVLGRFESGAGADSVLVKDSNGALLAEGDSVIVIKDLKVKGGSSDLKRGTVIKKIHLIDDPEAIECRVDHSTLVLKTCFLKKSG
jgi:protein PhnA